MLSRTRLSRLSSTQVRVLLVLGIHALLLFACFWSRHGSITTVRVEADGSEFRAYMDGRLKAQATLSAPANGALRLVIDGDAGLPSLPEPRGLSSIRVIELGTERVLLDASGSSLGAEPSLRLLRGSPSIDEGVFASNGRVTLALGDASWRDYAVELRLRNVASVNLTLRAEDERSGVTYWARPFRHLDSRLFSEGGSQAGVGGRATVSPEQTLRSMAAMLLQPYPFVFSGLALGLLSTVLLQPLIEVLWPRLRRLRVPETLPHDLAFVIVVFAFSVALYLLRIVGEGVPHVPDSVAYIFQAKVFASGRLAAPPPPVADAFDFFYPPLIANLDGRWASVFPFGHPLLLALGERFGLLWMVPPLIGAGGVALLYLLGTRLYGAGVALLAALLMATSPFFLMAASEFMSHNTAALYLLGALLALACVPRRPLLFGFLAGVCFGLLFNTRPLTAGALVLPWAAFLLFEALRLPRRDGLRLLGGFLAGGLLLLGAYLLYNQATTGDLLHSGYQATGQDAVGFSRKHPLAAGLQYEQAWLAYLLLVLDGWPVRVGVMLALLPFLLGTRRRWDWFLLLSAVCPMAAYALFDGSGIVQGPRFWYEVSPLLLLLSARGVAMAGAFLGALAAFPRRSARARASARIAAPVILHIFVLGLVGLSVYGWLLGQRPSWSADLIPAKAAELRGFNYIHTRLEGAIEAARLENALVLVEPCLHWQCYGSVFWHNDPDLNGRVVYARDLPGRREQLLQTYPGRLVYEARFDSASLRYVGRVDADGNLSP